MGESVVLRDLLLLKQAICNENNTQVVSLQQKYSGVVPDDLLSWNNWEQRFRRKDSFATLLVPEDIPSESLTPTMVTGNGNCLFNAASINLVGNEDMSVILRLLTAAELYIHADFYANHPRFKQVDMTMKEANKFMVALSVDISDGRNRLAALKQQAMSTCVNKKWAGLVELMALASVIKNTVFSVYPNASPSIRPLFHGIILPREAQDGSCGENCFIMWSRCSSFDTERVFQPNHFVTMTDDFIQDKVKPSYSDIVRGRTIKCGKLEGSTIKSFFSTKNQSANLQNSKAETNKTVTGQDKLSPTQWTKNSRGKRKENLEERNSARLSNSFSPPKTPERASMKKRSTFKEKARSSVEYKIKTEDHFQKETEHGNDLEINSEGVAYKAPPAHTEDSTQESVNEKDKKGDDPRKSTQMVEDTASSSNVEEKNSENLAENSGHEVDDLVSHTNVQQECADDLKGNTSGVEDKVQPVNTADSNRESINAKDKEGEELRESTQTVADSESPSINKEKKADNLKGSSEDEVDDMMSPTNVQHDEGDDFERTNNRGEDKAQPVNTADSIRESINAKDQEGEELRESTQTVADSVSPSINKEKNADNLKGSSEDEVDDLMSPTNVQHDEGEDFERSNNRVEDKAEPVYMEDSNGNRTKDEKEQESRGSKRSSSPESQSPSKRAKSAQSACDVSDFAVSMSLLLKPSLRHKKRQFSKAGNAKSSSATMFKHLTVLQSGKGDAKRKSGKENEEKKDNCEYGQHGIGKFLNVASPVPQPAHKEQGASSLLPLCVDQKWYVECGNRESHNRARADCRSTNTLRNEKGEILATNRSKVSGRLEDNIKAIDEKILANETSMESKRLLGIKAVGEYLLKHPIMPTQEAGKMLEACFEKPSNEPMRRKSVDIYELLSKQLNIIQIYIAKKAFLMENRDCQLLDVTNDIQKMFESFDFRSKLNTHVEDEIGDFYRTALTYLDTKRDRDTVKFLLTRVTSVNFMARLQGISNKKSLQNCSLTLPGKLEKFSTAMNHLEEKKEFVNLALNEKRGFLRRQKELIKERELRHHYKSRVSGRKLKVEEFPDIAAIIEYEFGDGDRLKRGGGGLESHSKLENDTLYRAADNKTNMADARLALLSLAPEDFSISLSCCYNYTQNFRKGTHEARRHHEGLGINACVSLHKAPDTAPIKDLVVNVHWSSANVNAILDEAGESPSETFVDSYDAKQVVRPNDKHNNKTWRRCEYQDHTYDQSRNNAITPMSHLFLKTEQTRRESTFNQDVGANKSDVLFRSYGREETTIHLKRTGRAVTVLRLSLYENETVFRSINELLFLMTLPHLDGHFRDPNTGKLKQSFVFVVDNGVDMPRSPLVQMLLVRLLRYLGLKKICQVSFAEYHSKRNPVERVHASEEKVLAKHGPFKTPKHDPHTEEHKMEMEEMAEEVCIVFGQAKFAGNPILCVRGLKGEDYVFDDEEKMHNFLAMNEQRKVECPHTYEVKKNKISQELSLVWGINASFRGEYAEDYQILENDTGSSVRTAWRDKYTTAIFDDSSLFQSYILQPVPDYVRWYLTDGEMHYMPFEQRRDFVTGPWDCSPELFLPTRILDIIFLCIPCLPSRTLATVGLLTWCPEEVVEKYLRKRAEEMEASYKDCLERERWRQHPLFAEKRESLEAKCKQHGLDCSGPKHELVKRLTCKQSLSPPPKLDQYSGDISAIPLTAKEIFKLPISTLKQVLHFYNIPTIGTKDQIVLRVLAIRTGTKNLLFARELTSLEDLIGVAEQVIREQIKTFALEDKILYREREYQRGTKPTISSERPRESASRSNEERQGNNGLKIPVGTSLSNLPDIFEDLKNVIQATREVNSEKSDADNVKDITTPGTRVVVLWNEGDSLSGWDPGWYTATVRAYTEALDEIVIEYVSEPDKRYNVKVTESVKEGTLKVLNVHCDSDLYDDVTQIGAKISVRWSGTEVKGTGWKAGWYTAEVQEFDPDNDTITIIYDREPNRAYKEAVTPAISKGEIRLKQSVL